MSVLSKIYSSGRSRDPFDFDAHVVFRFADFVKYFIILSVNFEPLCIRLIMSASTVKGDRKREMGNRQ